MKTTYQKRLDYWNREILKAKKSGNKSRMTQAIAYVKIVKSQIRGQKVS